MSEFGIAYAKSKYGHEVSLSSKKGYKLKVAMAKALKELSMLPDAKVALECWLDEDTDFVMELKRNDLENALSNEGGVLSQLESCIQKTLKEFAGKSGDPESTGFCDSVEIVGGGVRIPCVAQLIAKVSGISPYDKDGKEDGGVDKLCRGLDGSSAVATGTFYCTT